MLLSNLSLPIPANVCPPGWTPKPSGAYGDWNDKAFLAEKKKSVIAEHFIICKFGIKAQCFIAPVLGSPMSVTKIRTVVTITLGFYAMLLYPALKIEAQRSEMRVQLPSAPGKT